MIWREKQIIMNEKVLFTVLCIILFLCNSSFSNSNTDKLNSPPPTNDICSGAIELGLLDCGFYAQYDEDPEATADPEATGNCIDNTTPGQWYTFTTPDPIPYNSIFVASTWIDVEIFSTTTDCSALVYEGCGTGPFSFEPEAGKRYYYLTTGGFHMTLPFGGLSTCDDPLTSFSSCDSPIHSSSYTDCAWSDNMVPCPNDHVIWFDYTAGNSGADVVIRVDNYTGLHGNTADDVSISVFSDDCSSLLFGFDAAGIGYVCSALAGGQSITLEDLPPGFHVKIAIASGLNNAGHFDLFIETANEEGVSNDICDDAEEIFEGTTIFLSNICAEEDILIDDCPPQSEATVWYEYDPGSVPQDIEITLHSTGITSPAIAVYDDCWGGLLAAVCGTSLELYCIDYPIFIQIGSTMDNVGTFDLEIESEPSISALEPVITASPICSNSEAGIFISIPNGEIVNIIVEISQASSGLITGMTNQSFFGLNSALILDTLTNTSSVPEEAIYLITIETFGNACPTDPVEFAIMVYPEFKVNEIMVDECAPYLLEIDALEMVEGGTVPYLGILWYWNNSNLVGTSNILSLELVESGEITLKIIDFVGCRKEVVIDVDMTIRTDPTFDFDLSYCRTDQDSIFFPSTSLEGVEGIWSPSSIDLESSIEDDFYNILFTPNEEYCSNTVIDSVRIYSGDVPVFDLPDILCSEDSLFEFPSIDQNGIQGTWDISSLDLSISEGVYTNTFTHNNQDCEASFEYEIIVEPKVILNFGQPDSICRLEEPISLNNFSLEGYEGTWDVPIIDPDLVAGNSFTSTWTPTEGQAFCLKDTTITVQIIDPRIPEFTLPDELCTLDATFTFPIFDNQSLNGSWSIPSIDPSAHSGSVQSIFTSNDFCIEPFTWEIQIIDPLIPEFDIVTSLCSLDPIFTLPLVSDNGISGTWSIPTIDPSMMIGEAVEIEFQGDSSGPCVELISLTIEIVEALDVVFNLPSEVCWIDEDLLLPLISDNGIEGAWDPPLIDIESNLGTSVSSTFIPSDGSCANEEILTFEILSPHIVDPIVTDPSDCTIEDGSIFLDIIQGDNLEFSIDGGVSWQSSTIFSSLGSGGFTILVRSIDLSYCELSIEAFLSTPDGPVVNEVSSTDISNCTTANGSIIVDAEGINLEYSIDGGITWQQSNEFDNLPEGDYLINIREAMSDCIVEVGAMIMDFPQTEIVMVNTLDLSDCNMDNGQIEIIAEGEALEYSIDNGASWSTQNTFTNLPEGNYIILVQSTEGEDCIVSTMADLIAPSVPEIINIDTENATQCSPITGRIAIDAQGSNLEFSIDGGVTWQDDNVFSDLEAGTFHVIVRDSIRINCFDEVMVEIMLDEESLPESTIKVNPPSICDASDARIELTNALTDVEYSIDGGQSWQASNIFDNLLPGSYEIIIRKILLPECLITQAIEVPNTDCPCNDLTLEFEASNISCAGVESGRVELTLIEGMKDSDIAIEWRDGGTEQIIEGVDEGWQVVTIYYDDDCMWVDSVWVDLVQPIQFEWNTENQDCPDINNGTIEVINVSGGNGNYEYSLDDSYYQSENIFQELEEGEYQVYVRDDSGCLTAQAVEVYSNPKIEIYLAEIDSIFLGESVILDPGVDIMEIDSFAWSPTVDIRNPNELVVVVSPSITTIYYLDVYYGDCIESREILIKVFPKEEVHIGNVFSPNNDNNNDVLYIQGVPNSTIVLKDFSIYDRWGNEIFQVSQPEFNNKSDGWDGQYRNKNVVSGVYVYQVNYIQDEQMQVKIGTVTVLY